MVKLVPHMDGIQFRMHDEGGLRLEEQANFWKHTFAMIHNTVPNLRIDIRAEGLPDSTIQDALDAKLNVRVSTKFWMEQIGMPWNPTHINVQDQKNRRHGYADMLRYPQQYAMTWGLWNGGTQRVFTWGDPDFARRFVDATHIYPGIGDGGFDMDEPLATKMQAQAQDAKIFDLLKPQYKFYTYEFERYWHMLQLFGRLGYNPDTPTEVWDEEFNRRLRQAGRPARRKGLHRASQILPRIVGTVYPYNAFPMTRGWSEVQILGVLPRYATAETSDIAQFASFDEESAYPPANWKPPKCARRARPSGFTTPPPTRSVTATTQ